MVQLKMYLVLHLLLTILITMPLLLEFDVPDLDAGLRKTAVNVNNLS